ncbi:GntR family transcriptional regulator [Actinoallomurus purpureus]|uniref:GntR family transcriptional regulator n=1 Tax=Actinoallomurus purpureus TaxID=478114 RepID=UPI002093DB85|nr:GntR family transcriptional regulator [Actinoallomurus purpureus]MCO6009877.1 GntR family transcriptional regulator [Actinoallomurus purpureus]
MADPPYRDIERKLESRIDAGERAAGETLPHMEDLARHYGVSGNTVARAIVGLADRGRLVVSRSRERRAVDHHITPRPRKRRSPTRGRWPSRSLVFRETGNFPSHETLADKHPRLATCTRSL